MISAPLPPPRRLARALPTAFSLLALPVLVLAQDASDPPNLDYESATDSHRDFDDEALPAEGEVAGDRTTVMPDARTEPDVKGAGDRPVPVDPQASGSAAPSTAPDGGVMPVEPEAGDHAAANDATPAAEDAPQRAPALVYDSVLDDYAAYEESDGPNWIEANRVVGEIGGWRAYARELFESNDDEGEAR